MKKKLAVVGAAVAGLITLTGCSISQTEPDQVGLHYKAGPFSSTEFANCVDPGSREVNGPGDQTYYYFSNQRNYVFRGGPNDDVSRDTTAYTAPTKPGVGQKPGSSEPMQSQTMVTVEGQILFELNTECDTLREFHERIGKNKAWDEVLDEYLGQSLNRAITEATAQFTWEELYNDSAKKAAWEQSVKDKLPDYVKQATNGNYFRNFSVTLQKPIVPESLQRSIDNKAIAIQENEAQNARNAQINTELDSIKALVAVLGPDGYNTYQALKDGKISVLPIPQGSGVVLQPR